MSRKITTAEAGSYVTDAAIDTYSVYTLFPEEAYLFPKYYRPGESVLDLGCGLGRTTLRIHELGCLVKGIDISQPFVDLVQRRFPYLDIQLGDFADTLQRAESRDHVLIAYNGLDCAYPESERIRTLKECHRVLRPGGTLIFSSHNIRSLLGSPVYLRKPKSAIWMLRNFYHGFTDHGYVYDYWNTAHLFYGTQDYIVGQTERVGFELVEVVGRRASKSPLIITLVSPYVHYVFRKVIR
jgi:SAM-dependent methyltransferase